MCELSITHGYNCCTRWGRGPEVTGKFDRSGANAVSLKENKMDTLDCCNYDEERERLMIPSWLNPDWFTSIKTLIKLT